MIEWLHADSSSNATLCLHVQSTGKEDRLMPTSTGTVEMLKKHGFNAEFAESGGGHTLLNWRAYLIEFTPRLFQ